MDNFESYISQFISGSQNENHSLIIEFFLYFSRFEYAMKRCDYGKLGRDSKYWDADWVKLNTQLKKNIYFEKKSHGIGKILLSDPPRKMINQNEFEPGLIERSIIFSVKIVRNNLFHGGKFHGSSNEMESPRNIKLIEESLLILKVIIEDITIQFQDCNNLRNHFNEYI